MKLTEEIIKEIGYQICPEIEPMDRWQRTDFKDILVSLAKIPSPEEKMSIIAKAYEAELDGERKTYLLDELLRLSNKE